MSKTLSKLSKSYYKNNTQKIFNRSATDLAVQIIHENLLPSVFLQA